MWNDRLLAPNLRKLPNCWWRQPILDASCDSSSSVKWLGLLDFQWWIVPWRKCEVCTFPANDIAAPVDDDRPRWLIAGNCLAVQLSTTIPLQGHLPLHKLEKKLVNNKIWLCDQLQGIRCYQLQVRLLPGIFSLLLLCRWSSLLFRFFHLWIKLTPRLN